MTATQTRIRRAEKQDCPQMLELIRELAIYEREPDAVTVSLEHFEESGFGKAPVWWAFVAVDECSGSVIGFALYYIRYSTWKGQRMYLEDLIVTEAARGKGIGGLLMNALFEEARMKHYQGISWQVLGWNEAAINFYRRYNVRFDGEWLNAAVEV